MVLRSEEYRRHSTVTAQRNPGVYSSIPLMKRNSSLKRTLSLITNASTEQEHRLCPQNKTILSEASSKSSLRTRETFDNMVDLSPKFHTACRRSFSELTCVKL